MIKQSNYIITILALLLLFRGIGTSSEAGHFPSINQLKTILTDGSNPIILGTVRKIGRMPFYEQRPLKQFSAHSWEYYSFIADVFVNKTINIPGVMDRPKTGKRIKLALQDNALRGYTEYPFKLIIFKNPSRITYLNENVSYIFLLAYHTGYRENIYALYHPVCFEGKACCNKEEIIKYPNKFYIYPMKIAGNTVEVPVQYYGSKEILKKKFKYDEIISLYK